MEPRLLRECLGAGKPLYLSCHLPGFRSGSPESTECHICVTGIPAFYSIYPGFESRLRNSQTLLECLMFSQSIQ
jgi:hypothetical protein